MSDLTLEDIALEETLDYKTSPGGRGEQIMFRECPSCGNEKWKVYANAESGLGNCFSCQATFNVWKFVGWVLDSQGRPSDNRSIGQYLDTLRKKLGYRVKRRTPPKPAVKVVLPFELPTSAAIPYEDGWVHPYLLRRGIDGHYASMFHLRYSAFGKHRYVDDKGATIAQSFAERIIIPVFDLDGKLVTFQGRDVTELSETRYKFAGGLPGTGRYLYNGHTALARHASSVCLVEGPFDVFGAQKAFDAAHDLNDVVPLGSFGMHLSGLSDGDDQVTAFRKLKAAGLKRVTLMWDAETKAYRRALEACQALTKVGLEAAIATLPPGSKDPGGADARFIIEAYRSAKDVTSRTLPGLTLRDPYRAR